jgi:hypothetical protein
MNLPKLTPDQIKKLALSTMGFIFLLYVYFSFFLGPLNKSRQEAQAAIADRQHKIDTSKSELQKAANLERQAKDATARFATLKSLSPDGAPIAWFPPRMKSFFADQHIDKAVARLEKTAPCNEPDLVAWSKYSWIIELPQVDYESLGNAVAGLENAEALLTVTRINVHPVAEEPQFQQVAITATTVIQKR